MEHERLVRVLVSVLNVKVKLLVLPLTRHVKSPTTIRVTLLCLTRTAAWTLVRCKQWCFRTCWQAPSAARRQVINNIKMFVHWNGATTKVPCLLVCFGFRECSLEGLAPVPGERCAVASQLHMMQCHLSRLAFECKLIVKLQSHGKSLNSNLLRWRRPEQSACRADC